MEIEKRNYYTVEEIASIIRVSRDQVRNMLREGLFTGAIRPGRRWLIPYEALMEILNIEYGEGRKEND